MRKLGESVSVLSTTKKKYQELIQIHVSVCIQGIFSLGGCVPSLAARVKQSPNV